MEQIQDLVYDKKENEKSLESLITQSDSVFDETAKARKKLESKVADIIDTITIDDKEDAKSIDAKVSLLKAYDDILVNREKAFEKRITIRQKQKVADTASQLADIVTETLSKMSFYNEYVPSSKVELTDKEKREIDSKLSQLDNLDDIDISEGEISKSNKK